MTNTDEKVDKVTMVRYSIKFYYTKEFARETPEIDGFILQVSKYMYCNVIQTAAYIP